MKLVILAVGRGRATPEQELATEWLARLPQGGELIEVESKLPAGDARRTDEGQRLLRHCPDNIPLVACDPRGRDTSSEAMAKLLARWRDTGMASACFAIWPHMLFRAMLAEQLYRATMILAGHPYHRGN